jgi:hypothetical protein
MNVFELFGTIAINNRDANSALTDTATRAERTGKRIQAAFKNIGGAALKIGKVVGAGAAAIGTAFVAGVESTRDYRTEMAKLNSAYLANGHSADTAIRTYKALQAVLGETDQAVEAANHLAVLTNKEEDLAKWTDICTGVYATFGASLPIEGLTESANETSKVGQVTGSLADALNWAGISEEDFNKKLSACTTDAERQDLIMNTLYWTYKAAADQYKETAGNVMEANAAQDNLNAALARLGEIGEPILSGVKNWIADMVTAATPYIESFIQDFSDLGTTWSTKVWPMIQNGVKMQFGIELPDWETTKTSIVNGWETVKTAVKESLIVQAIIDTPDTYAEIGQKILSGWETVKTNIKGAYKVVFGVEMPESWNDIALAAGKGWEEVVMPAISDFFKVTFGVDMPSWSDITARIVAGWQSVMNSVAGLFNIDIGYGTTGGSFMIEENHAGAMGSFASGLDRVPNDGYIARLHRDEAVLNSRDAAEWRSGGSSRIEALLSELVGLTRAGQVIQLDSGIMAGQLTPAIDAQMGTIARNKGRGN